MARVYLGVSEYGKRCSITAALVSDSGWSGHCSPRVSHRWRRHVMVDVSAFTERKWAFWQGSTVPGLLSVFTDHEGREGSSGSLLVTH
jgi:hypothetical protein